VQSQDILLMFPSSIYRANSSTWEFFMLLYIMQRIKLSNVISLSTMFIFSVIEFEMRSALTIHHRLELSSRVNQSI
jgi:hypothetical protein